MVKRKDSLVGILTFSMYILHRGNKNEMECFIRAVTISGLICVDFTHSLGLLRKVIVSNAKYLSPANDVLT